MTDALPETAATTASASAAATTTASTTALASAAATTTASTTASASTTATPTTTAASAIVALADAPVTLKSALNQARLEQIAQHIAAVHPTFNRADFLSAALAGWDALSLMQRVRRISHSLSATLPANYAQAIEVLRAAAPALTGGFVSIVPPDFVGVYGRGSFDLSMDALKFFTPFGTSEFGIREFLRLDQLRALRIMEGWSHDADPAVRRLASEGCRPRLPWSFHLPALIENPAPVAQILENLRDDESVYVRKSVANHLNDIARDHPDWVLARLGRWPLAQPNTAWIARHALRTLIKRGDQRALALIGAGAAPEVNLQTLSVLPGTLSLGARVTLTCVLQSTSDAAQRLVVDYVLHYVKKSGQRSGKVFKLKEFTLAPRASITLTRTQQIRDFTTRVHHAGRHDVDVMVNGVLIGKSHFDLTI